MLSSLAEGGYSVEFRAGLAILVWGTVLLGVAFGFFPRSRPPAAALFSGLLLAALVALSGMSVLWSADDGAAVHEFLRAGTYLGLFALVVCAAREGEARAWLIGIALGIIGVAILALMSRLVPSLPGGDEEITEFLPAAQGRLSYPIGYWNALATLLALGAVLLTWFGAFARSLAGRATAVGVIPLLGLDLYMTSSRGGFAALALGLVVLVALGPRRPALIASAAIGAIGTALAVALASGQTDLLDGGTGAEAADEGLELLTAAVACVIFAGVARAVTDGLLSRVHVSSRSARTMVAVTAVAALVALIVSNPVERFDDFKSLPEADQGGGDFIATHLGSGSGSGRWQFWSEAVDAFESQPLHGIGAGGYGNYWNQHATIDQVITQAHSLYLEQLAELGPLALLALAGFLLIGPVTAVRRRGAFPDGEIAATVAIVAAGAAAAAIDWSWEVPVVFGVVVIALALVSGPALADGSELRLATAGRTRYGWGIGLLLIGWVSLIFATASFLAAQSLDDSRSAAADGELSRANDEARDAITLEPWSAEPRLQLALVQESAGELDAADDSIAEAIERADDDWRLWLVRARIATLDSRVDAANAAFDRARELNPRAPVFTGLQGPLSPAP